MSRQAIVTKYHGPTNSTGARISATAYAGRIYWHYDHALDAPENHRAAAIQLANRYGWLDDETPYSDADLVGGSMPSQDGYCFVIDDREHRAEIVTGTWKDILIDAILNDRFDEAMSMLVEHIDENESDPIRGGWSIRDSVDFYRHETYMFTLNSDGREYGKQASPAPKLIRDVRDVRTRVLAFLNS